MPKRVNNPAQQARDDEWGIVGREGGPHFLYWYKILVGATDV